MWIVRGLYVCNRRARIISVFVFFPIPMSFFSFSYLYGPFSATMCVRSGPCLFCAAGERGVACGHYSVVHWSLSFRYSSLRSYYPAHFQQTTSLLVVCWTFVSLPSWLGGGSEGRRFVYIAHGFSLKTFC